MFSASIADWFKSRVNPPLSFVPFNPHSVDAIIKKAKDDKDYPTLKNFLDTSEFKDDAEILSWLKDATDNPPNLEELTQIVIPALLKIKKTVWIDKNGDTAAHYAVTANHPELCQHVLATLPLSLTKTNLSDNTPLMAALDKLNLTGKPENLEQVDTLSLLLSTNYSAHYSLSEIKVVRALNSILRNKAMMIHLVPMLMQNNHSYFSSWINELKRVEESKEQKTSWKVELGFSWVDDFFDIYKAFQSFGNREQIESVIEIFARQIDPLQANGLVLTYQLIQHTHHEQFLAIILQKLSDRSYHKPAPTPSNHYRLYQGSEKKGWEMLVKAAKTRALQLVFLRRADKYKQPSDPIDKDVIALLSAKNNRFTLKTMSTRVLETYDTNPDLAYKKLSDIEKEVIKYFSELNPFAKSAASIVKTLKASLNPPVQINPNAAIIRNIK